MRPFIILLLTVFYAVGGISQKTSPSPGIDDKRVKAGMERVLYPGLAFPDYPQLQLTGKSRFTELPAVVDNSIQPYLRPVFRQQGASCGQAASVAYNFCYEINRLRGLHSDTSINQYPSHFVWNFMNGTLPYYGEGVSYYHTYDILYDAGCPTEDVYGPITMDDSYYWMNGYDGYLRAMYNRVSGMNSIHAGTPDGLIVLKHWLHNHLEGSETGGVANFYAGYLDYHTIPEGTPEAGKFININFYQLATHAMTIVGYNDSVRYDVNNDGLFTNHIDITGDGITDMADWEIGALKFVNSYGDTWADSGFCYMLYRTLALKYGQGGIWNNSVHVLFPDTSYKPRLTIKARLRHDKRGRIRITAGISSDTARHYPEKTISFSIFNYQGLDYYMAGNNDPEGKTLEFGLDITPLLSYSSPSERSRIFLIIDEKDPDGRGNGTLKEFSVLAYHNSDTIEFKCEDTPLELLDNDRTLASVVIGTEVVPLRVLPDTTIVVETAEQSEIQFSAAGGYPPYQWELKHIYDESEKVLNYIIPEGAEGIPTNPYNGYCAVPLPFRFPFFGRFYDTLYQHVNGYLMFEKQDMPYYYLLFDEPYLRQIRAIACYMNKDFALHEITANYLIVSTQADKVIFGWRISDADGLNFAEFSASVYPDGKIEIHFGPNYTGDGFYPVTGLGNGSGSETIYSEYSGLKTKEGQLTTFYPSSPPFGLSLSDSGLLSVQPGAVQVSNEIAIKVSDASRLTTEKRIVLTTGPEVIISPANPLQAIIPGTIIPLHIEIKNHSNQSFGNLTLSVSEASSNLLVKGGPVAGLTVQPGQSVVIDDTFSLSLSDTINSPQVARIMAGLSSDSLSFCKISEFPVELVMIKVSPPVVVDGNNHLPDPGEEADLVFTISNYGSASAGNLNATLHASDAFAAIHGESFQELGEMGGHSKKTFSYRIKINDAAPPGRLTMINLRIENSETLVFEENFFLYLGKPVILLSDLDKNYNSALHMAAALRELNISYDYTQFIDSSLFDYDFNFVFLGHYSQNHMLTPSEDSLCTAFLDQGKGFYLEGGSFFKFNPPTMLRTKMRTQGAYNAWTNRPDTLIGIPGMPVNGIQFDYTGDWNRTENLLPLEPAEPWFRDKNSGLDFVVALDSGNYKTISSSVEFGGTTMFNGPGRRELMKRYLEFLGYQTEPLSVTFQVSSNHICKGSGVSFIPVSSGEPTSYHWVFPGGSPPDWEGPAPFIRYDSAGIYDASVTVSDGINFNTFSLDSIIVVDPCIGIQVPIQSKLQIYPNPAGDFFMLSRGNEKINIVTVADIQGRILLSEAYSGDSSVLFRLGKLASGLYVVTAWSDSGSSSSKLVVR